MLFKSYFNAFDEDAVRNNFVLIYELLDGAPPVFARTLLPGLTRPPAGAQRSWTTATRKSWRRKR